ncbi:MAG: ribonuclease PH [Opitutales bacterium]|nr:ribonuclease PH [Opitutales bacterium]
MDSFKRIDSRLANQLREVSIQPDIAPNAPGSVLVSFGNTRVICGVSYEKRVPHWMIQQGVGGGWMSAEYSMLPYSTIGRKPRDVGKGKQDGRSVEIQRLIGRAMRAVCDLSKLPGYTLWIDCDVLQADGGTRTASITGAYVAAQLAVRKMLAQGLIKENPFSEAVAAVSVGIVDERVLLDLAYSEDSAASVDSNVVMTASGRFVEFSCSGEEATFERSQVDEMAEMATFGIAELLKIQAQALV